MVQPTVVAEKAAAVAAAAIPVEKATAAAVEPPMAEPAKPSPVAPTPPARTSGRGAAPQDDARLALSGIGNEAKGGDSPLAAAPDYAFGARLDPGPRPLEDIEPDYPDMAYLREGVVVLRLLISDTGRVDDVGVVRAEPPGVFDQSAIEAFAKARFSPGLAAGRPVKSQITVEVQFMPINRGARVSGRTY